MKVRTRLVLAFAYILITVIVALTVPLAINLRVRTTNFIKDQARVDALTIAAGIGAEGIAPGNRDLLQRQVQRYADDLFPPGRVTIMDPTGKVVADAEAPGSNLFGTGGQPAVHQNYNTTSRPEVQDALSSRPMATALIRPSQELGHDLLAAAAPILDENPTTGKLELQGAVRITQDVQNVSDSVRRVTIGVVVIGATGLLAGLVVAIALAGGLAKPLTTMARAAKQLGAGDLSSRVGDVEGGREFDEVAHSFDEMADRLERTVQAQREFVANASHQLRTPLTGMKLRLESAKADAPTQELKSQIEAADREVDRLAEIVDRLLTMAREIEEGQPTSVDLGDAAGRAVDRWRDRAQKLQSTLEASGPGALALGNPGDLDQMLDNLIDNAIAYAPGAIRVETGRADDRVFVAVRDHGPGIPKEEQARVTDRFYRGKGAPAGGSGLGLTIARQLAEKWGGTLTVSAADGGGARVEVRLRPAGTGRPADPEQELPT